VIRPARTNRPPRAAWLQAEFGNGPVTFMTGNRTEKLRRALWETMNLDQSDAARAFAGDDGGVKTGWQIGDNRCFPMVVAAKEDAVATMQVPGRILAAEAPPGRLKLLLA
jgi:hypothetical protein